MNTDVDRDRGVLTPADRAYLLGEREFGHEGSKRNAEARIRDRVTQAVLDFDLLLHTLSAKDRRLIFDRAREDAEFLDGLRAAIALTYIGTGECGVDFERVLVPAVRSSEEAIAAFERGKTVSVDVTFEVEVSVEEPLDGVEARLEEGEPVTPRELFSLVMRGGFDTAAHDRIDLVRAHEDDVEREFLERLASYLDGTLRRPGGSTAVIDLNDGD